MMLTRKTQWTLDNFDDFLDEFKLRDLFEELMGYKPNERTSRGFCGCMIYDLLNSTDGLFDYQIVGWKAGAPYLEISQYELDGAGVFTQKKRGN